MAELIRLYNLEPPIQVLLVLFAFKRCVECLNKYTFIAVK